ncbi:unnamed protein product, partial [Ectocarpus sp. 4 AP-2014]
GGGGGGFQADNVSPGQAGSGRHGRFSLSGQPQQQQQQRQVSHSSQVSPPLQAVRQRHEQPVYGSGSRRSSSPGGASVRGGRTFSSAGGGASSSLANNPDDSSTIFGSNVSGHSSYSGFSAMSSMHAFGGSELGNSSSGGMAGGNAAADGSSSGNNNPATWRTPPLGSQKGDPGDESGNPPAHGSTGGALGWGSIMGSGGATRGTGEGPD